MVSNRDYSPIKKALEVNLDDSIYGTFAEIGAGQEVARFFFQAGRASHTVAKSMSAYDMTFSDAIYGKESRYVCESRLLKMLDHEYSLLEERLRSNRGKTSRFFAFADTVATASQEDGIARPHGWMGIRFQTEPEGPYNDIILHVKLWDQFRLQQQEALGVLGVNLLHMAFFPPETASKRISVLLESLSNKRVEVNMIRFSGPSLAHLDNRLLNLELVKQDLTEAVLFGAGSEVVHAGDQLFRKPVLVQRGTFRPVTTSNIEILKRVTPQFKNHPLVKGNDPLVLFEITMNSLAADGGHVDDEDFLHRVDALSAEGQQVLVSNFSLFYQMRAFLRQCTREAIGIVVGAPLLSKMFDEEFYLGLPGGILEGMSRLFDDKSRVFVIPQKDNKTCQTAKSFHPKPQLENLYKHLAENGYIVDALSCDDLDTSIHSADVREMMKRGDKKWMAHVPEKARQLIIERQLFGYRPD